MALSRWRSGCRWTVLAMMVCAVVVPGCAQLNVPRIDPTGDRIFAEPLVSTDPVYGDLPGPIRARHRKDVVVCPQETVAPVGSEVVVLAGVVGSDDYLRTNERVEWMLEPGGTGQFVDLNKQTPMDLLVGDFNWPRKVDDTFAIGSTSRRYLRLTRGTPTPTDDVYVQRGQAWITVTSPGEGISRVTAYAPNVYSWDCRKQTATIHWVNAQWSFPPPAINPAGTKHPFTTTVTRQTDGAPCVGWRVRYEILDGPAAGFAPQGTQAMEVATDEFGQACVEIFQQQPAAGTNRIAIQVIRPAELGGGKQLVVGSGSTLKTWSAPDIAVRKTGPAVASVGATLTYQIEVSNPGDLPADGVTLTDVVPGGLTYLRSNPAGELAGRSVRWRLGTLAAGETRSVEIDFRADRAGNVTNSAQAAAQGGLDASDSAATAVSTPSIDLQVYGPEQPVNVGDEVTFKILVTNRGQLPAAGLVIKDRFDPGLEHAEAPSPIERELGMELAPGQSQEIGVVLRVTRAGRLCNTAEVIGDGQIQATASACVTAVEARGPEPEPELRPTPTRLISMSVKMTGPQVGTVGEKVVLSIEVVNTGEQPLTGVRVASSLDPSLNPARATFGYQREGDDLFWTVDDLPPGTTRRFQLECDCLTTAIGATSRVRVTTQEGAQGEDSVYVEIRPAPALMPANLEMTVEDRHDPIDVGKQKTFIVRVVNNGQTPDQRVTLVVTLPPEMELVRFSTIGPPSTDYTEYRQVVRFDPVDTIGPGQTLEYRIRVSANEAGDVRLRAELTSQSLLQPAVVEEGTLINPER